MHRGLESVDPPVLELLRLGACQILYLDGVPDYAAVSATVEQARSVAGSRSGGFVNAVLRRVAEAGDGPERFPAFERDPLGFLSTWGSHPRWLIERWLVRWGPEAVRTLVERDNRRPDVFVVPLATPVEDAVVALDGAGIAAEPAGGGSGCVRLESAGDVARALEVVAPALVQDPAANLVTVYADVPSGTMVADFCAAPGGKVLALPASPSRILAADRSESRIQVLRENARRIGREVTLAVADARRPPVRSADVVLLDVPCTGTGTLARHPDARWRLTEDAVSTMASLQDDILEAAAEVVVPGGLLVYSTCTLEPEENEERIAAFLQRHGDFAIEPTEATPRSVRAADGTLSVTPHEHGFDGAWAARLRRAA